LARIVHMSSMAGGPYEQEVGFMKLCTAFVVPLLVVLLASTAIGSIVFEIDSAGDTTTYNYTYTNTEEPGDIILGVHLFAPIDPVLIIGWSADPGWSFGSLIDPTGAADIFWTTDDEIKYGLLDGDSVSFSMSTSSSITPVYDYVLEDFPVGNWGYDRYVIPGTWVMNGSLPVPGGSPAESPEPATLLAMLGGLGALIARRKK